MEIIARKYSIINYFFCRVESSNRIILLGYVLLILLCNSTNCFCQWRKIFQAIPADRQVQSVYFKEFSKLPLDGFVSVDDPLGTRSELWHTLDGGLTWNKLDVPSTASSSSFTFKDSIHGWFSGWNGNGSPGIFRTIDGGTTWIFVTNALYATGITYVKATDLLIASGLLFMPAYFYSSDGINFLKGPTIPGFNSGGASVTFSDDLHGILSSPCCDPPCPIAYTSDGGLTWNLTPRIYSEYFGPVGIKGTATFFAISECPPNPRNPNLGKVMRTDNGGIDWNFHYSYPINTEFPITGTMQYGTNISLFFQTTVYGSEGIMMSTDSGNTFHSICGPINDLDTRFYVRDSFIYAGDKQGGLWLNTTGIGSNSTPQFSVQKLNFSTPGCKQFDTALTFTFFDSCNGIQAKLVSASIQGSNSFSFSSPSAIPRIIHPDDSLMISYNPQTAQRDTAALHLKFHLGWKDFDTTIQLFGSGRIPKETVQFIPQQKSYSAATGGIASIGWLPDKNISGRNLDSISFDLLYNTDLLDYRNISTSIPGASVELSPYLSLFVEKGKKIVVRGANMTLDSTIPIITFNAMAMVAKTQRTAVTMTNLHLNGGDQAFHDCILSADTSVTEFRAIDICGDSTLRNYLLGIPPLQITSIRPNPAQDEIEINLRSAIEQHVTIEIFDALGENKLSDKKNLMKGSNTIHLNTKGLSSGMYLVKIGEFSQSLVISR